MTHVGQMLIRVHDGKVASMYDIQMLVFMLAKKVEKVIKIMHPQGLERI